MIKLAKSVYKKAYLRYGFFFNQIQFRSRLKTIDEIKSANNKAYRRSNQLFIKFIQR